MRISSWPGRQEKRGKKNQIPRKISSCSGKKKKEKGRKVRVASGDAEHAQIGGKEKDEVKNFQEKGGKERTEFDFC